MAEVKTCGNCYHYQEFGHCSCRETVDVRDGCEDWHPIESCW